MTNLDIIKYLALNNPSRLAKLLDDIYDDAYIAGYNDDVDAVIHFDKWLSDDASQLGVYYRDGELEEWSKDINHPSIEITYPDNLVIQIPYEGKDPNHMWNTDNNFNIISQAIEEIELLETITEPGKYCGEVYDNFRKNVCAYCLNPNCMRGRLEIDNCLT